MSTLRDDMTLAEAQAEATRRWPGAALHCSGDGYCLRIREGVADGLGRFYFAATAVGCLDQAIASEARRKEP